MATLVRNAFAGLAVLLAAAAAGSAARAQAAAGQDALYCSGLDLAESYDGSEGLAVVSVGRDGYLFSTTRALNELSPYSRESFHYIRRLAEALKWRGTNLVMAVTPPRGVVLHAFMDPDRPEHAAFSPERTYANYSANIEVLRQAGVIAPNLLDAVLVDDPVLRTAVYFHDDFHWAPQGARLSAEAIAQAIRAHPDAARLTAHDFALESLGFRDTYGPYSDAVDQICGVRPPSKRYEFFATPEAPAGPATSADLLIDEPAESSESLLFGPVEENIVLVGTSFSQRVNNDANFPGMLAHYAGAFVDNRAVAGGGLTTTIEGYLRSRDFQNQPPPFLVWELAAYYDIDGEPAFFRAVIPEALGECAAADAVASGAAELRDGRAVLVAAAGGAPIPVDRTFLFLEVDDLSLVKFTLEIEDATGFVDRVPIDRSTRVLNDGRFFLELLDLGAPVVEVRLAYDGDHRGDVATRVCREPAGVAPLF
ncbi:MAG: hypothetical protein R3F55_10980 [Alphaproteobacteria bacterium]